MTEPELVVAELAEAHRRELRKLDDIAFALLDASQNNTAAAERMLEDLVSLIYEGGVLSTWRYRILLAKIREGL